jgi:hypothetical protein
MPFTPSWLILEPLGLHRFREGPERLSLGPQTHHLANGRLLGLLQRQLAVLTATIAKRYDAAEGRWGMALDSLRLINLSQIIS